MQLERAVPRTDTTLPVAAALIVPLLMVMAMVMIVVVVVVVVMGVCALAGR